MAESKPEHHLGDRSGPSGITVGLWRFESKPLHNMEDRSGQSGQTVGLRNVESKHLRVRRHGLEKETDDACENPREDSSAAGSGEDRRGLHDLVVFF